MPNSTKNVQMPLRFVLETQKLLYWLDDYDLEPHVREICDELHRDIVAKLEAQKRREAYSQRLEDQKNAP